MQHNSAGYFGTGLYRGILKLCGSNAARRAPVSQTDGSLSRIFDKWPRRLWQIVDFHLLLQQWGVVTSLCVTSPHHASTLVDAVTNGLETSVASQPQGV